MYGLKGLSKPELPSCIMKSWRAAICVCCPVQDFDFFVDALRSVFFLTIGCVIVIQFLAKHVGEEALQGFLVSAASLLP